MLEWKILRGISQLFLLFLGAPSPPLAAVLPTSFSTSLASPRLLRPSRFSRPMRFCSSLKPTVDPLRDTSAIAPESCGYLGEVSAWPSGAYPSGSLVSTSRCGVKAPDGVPSGDSSSGARCKARITAAPFSVSDPDRVRSCCTRDLPLLALSVLLDDDICNGSALMEDDERGDAAAAAADGEEDCGDASDDPCAPFFLNTRLRDPFRDIQSLSCVRRCGFCSAPLGVRSYFFQRRCAILGCTMAVYQADCNLSRILASSAAASFCLARAFFFPLRRFFRV